MLINRLLKISLGLITLDCILRVVILGFWFFSPESVPGMPVFYKGVKYPEIQGAILAMSTVILIAAALPSWRTPRSFSFLASLSVVVGLINFVIGFFYSYNVASSGLLFVVAANGFRQAAKTQDA